MIVGIQESFIDYPDHICVMIFTKTCRWNCVRCHNKKNLSQASEIPFDKVLSYLRGSLPLINRVTISGGEPTEDKNLPNYVKEISRLGFYIKLDTNGSNPEVLEELLPYLSVVAMDVKNDFSSYEKYSEITNCSETDYFNFLKSLKLLSDECNKNHIKLLLRTTMLKDNIDTDKIRQLLTNYTYSDYVVQKEII